jgi:chromosome segregation ATPase
MSVFVVNKLKSLRNNLRSNSLLDKSNKERRARYDRLSDSKNRPDPNANYFEMYQELQKKFEGLIADNTKQKEILQLRQDTFMRREKRSREKQEELTLKLKQINTIRGDTTEQLDQLDHLKKTIQVNIQKMKGETERQLELKQLEYQKHIDDIISDYKQQLLEERKRNSTGIREWNEKSRSLKENLKKATIKAMELAEKNRQLLQENQNLKCDFQEQQNDREELARTNAKINRENQKLREQTNEMETHLESFREMADTLSPRYLQRIADGTFDQFVEEETDHQAELLYKDYIEKEKKLLENITKLKKSLEQEKKNTKYVYPIVIYINVNTFCLGR